MSERPTARGDKNSITSPPQQQRRLGHKLLRRRKDGTLGPLFIASWQRIPVGEWLLAQRMRVLEVLE